MLCSSFFYERTVSLQPTEKKKTLSRLVLKVVLNKTNEKRVMER